MNGNNLRVRVGRNGLTPMQCVDRIELGNAASEEEVLAAYQDLVDTGYAWSLQGFYGRNAARLIEAGLIEPAQGGA